METVYELMSAGENAQNLFMCAMIWTCSNSFYSLFCHQSSNLFGCIGLRNKEYCIFNRQYTKDEYTAMLPKIIRHMNEMPFTNRKGTVYRFGEFFPNELSPFTYNETPAGDYYPLEKNVVLTMGFNWKEKEKNNYNITLHTKDIPDNIQDVPASLLDEIIECEDYVKECSPGAFRMISSELQLYKKMNLPLPRKSPNVRFYERLKKRLPYKLWHRSCVCTEESHDHDGKCPNEFETSYAPDRPEIVYCEKCYQNEVM